jgi:predicted ATPase/signal transduction histidine kinase/tRNA A-37 threonylcarbamoyl transferase component Bud32
MNGTATTIGARAGPERGSVAASAAYRLGERLQTGQGADVYRAVRVADGKPIVLKVLDAKHSRPRDVDRLRHENALGATLSGLAVVTPLALTSFEGLPALELEDFRGASVDRLLTRPVPIDTFLRLATRVARAVAGIHARGLIHKDLKPHNILLDDETGEVRINDFCIASRVAREQTTARPARLIEGSLPYVSPEQTGRMNRSIDSRSDLYSLGVTFYQLLTGRLPFEASDAVGWVHGHVARRPPPPDAIRASVPAPLSDIVLKLLAKVPDERYQTASGLAYDLDRCQEQWRRTGAIAPFRLGEHDASDRFLIPQRLYGRTTERAVLQEAFERVADTGLSELVLVSGVSGIGKSSVVHELHRPIAERRGIFASGKFEEHKRDIPYSTVIHAFREVMLDILVESAESIAGWQARLRAALGQDGQLVVDLIPEVGLFLGPQPPVPELPLADAEIRLRRVLRAFVGAFGADARPLTLFLDDLQWCDPASLKLLGDLVTNRRTRHLLVIGAYRDNEVGPGHPLARALDEAREEGARIRPLVLGPLPETCVSEIVADTLHCGRSEARALARLVRDRTGGNPFFVMQFLTALHGRGLISFDRDVGHWRWDIQRIRAEGYTDNVADLLVRKLHGLPAQTQETLKLAASLGAGLDAETLAIVFGRDPEVALQAALEEDLLLRVGESYRFPHDRVQEAAYSLIPEDERAAVHLHIGRLLLARVVGPDLEERIFDVVTQLNRGAGLITSVDERERVAELNLLAGLRAQRSTAYASALRYFVAGAALLDEDAWDRRPELRFGLELRRAECEVVTGAFAPAEQRLALLMKRARSVVDAASVACQQINLYMTLGQPHDAVAACLAHLRRVGVEWSPHPTSDEVRAELARMWQQIGDRQIEELIDLPSMTDPIWRATVEVLTMASAPAGFTDENLCALAVARAVNLSLEHGNSAGSSQAYVLLGEILGPYSQDYQLAFRFGKLGLDLVERNGPLRFAAPVYLLFALMVNPWARHARSSLALEQRALEAAERTGNVQFACYAHNDIVTFLLATGEPLTDVERSAEEALTYVRRAKFGLVEDTLVTKLRLVRALRGTTPRLSSFDGDDFRESEFERRLDGTPSLALAACWYWIRKLQGRVLALDPAAAVAAAEKAATYLWTGRSYPEILEYHFYAGLAHAAAHDVDAVERRPAHAQAVAEHAAQLERWAAGCPENFENRAALVGAELARLRGEPEAAARRYEQAIRSARDNGFVQNEALAYETAARFYRSRNFDLIANHYLSQARDRYLTWGAEGKVRELERQHPVLVESEQAAPAATIAMRSEQLDLLSVVKASQTISGVMIRDRILRTLLGLVLEASGARRASVLLVHEGQLEVAGEVGAEEAAPIRVRPAATDLPLSLIKYVQRTQERVLLDDAASQAGRFVGDDYFARVRPRSVLCLPIRRQAETVALLYLENDLVSGAFTPERLLVLELLAAQAAISLENALLLEREHAGRLEAERAERRARLLGEATAVMTTTLDHDGAFSALTRLCVRDFADWAIIDLIEGDRAVRLAGAHRDPQKEALLRELAERYPAGPGSSAPAGAVLEGGRPILIASGGEAEWRAHAVDERHVELVKQLGTRSLIVVPLIARDTLLGALTLASATPAAFLPADLEVATEIGRRAALAVDNARLLRETQRAVQLRDDFLMVASHELRTPMTSLLITVGRLRRSAAGGGPPSAESLNSGLDRVEHSAGRLRRLTDELLDVTRLERGRLDLDPVRMELGKLVRQVVDDLQVELAAAGCQVRIDADEAVAGVWDPSRLEQVITNLLTNAMKFGQGRPIEIGVHNTPGGALLSVRDYGLGVAPERQPFIFNRFERAVSTRHYGGLGLGLYISRRIVDAHGGQLRLESEPGHGATFTATLPPTVPSPTHT